MSSTSPPLEAQRFGRSQTPESPRPVHLPEPANIPVLRNQMDPVFNDTATYDIRSGSQPYSLPSKDNSEAGNAPPEDPNAQSQAVRNFLLGAQMANERAENNVTPVANAANSPQHSKIEQATPGFPSLPSNAGSEIQSTLQALQSPQLPQPNNTAAELGQESGQRMMSATTAATLSNDVAPQSSYAVAGPQTSANGTHDGIDYRTLLETISQSASTAPAADPIENATTSAPSNDETLPPFTAEKSLPAGIGLPPKPPPLENPANFPDYASSDNYNSYYANPASGTSSSFQSSNPPFPMEAGAFFNSEPAAPPLSNATNSLPPPPALSTFQNSPFGQSPNEAPGQGSSIPRTPSQMETERPWGPEIQSMYDQFLADERNYVTEGVWDRFPMGSRLFVGNLPTEKVTKRDLFHIFHRHGRLAQISIKQAYGFVQFLESNSCHSALSAEQGVELRGRKLHLEISKPQKNTRNAGGGNNKQMSRRRSRSPDRNAARANMDRSVPNGRASFPDYRDESVRRRDDYRPVRSPSPRGFRGRDEFRSREDGVRGYARYDGRPRSPPYGGSSFRPPSPKVYDEDAVLPLPRRDPRDVPDVQILVLEEVPHNFIDFVEQGFRAKGLAAQTIWLNPRITLAAVIKRQIIEGVQAVVKVTRNMQFTSKIPLQVFDRTPGTSNVNFNEYVDLDVQIAADVVVQARQKERMNLQRPAPAPVPFPLQQGYQGVQPQFPYGQTSQIHPPYGQQPAPQYQQARPPTQQQPYPQQHGQPYGTQQQQQFPTPSTGGSNLQELLANLRQPSANQQSTQQPAMLAAANQAPSDLANLLSNVAARQQNQSNAYTQGHSTSQQSPFGQYANGTPAQAYQPPAAYGAQAPQQNVQNIMDQLARYSR